MSRTTYKTCPYIFTRDTKYGKKGTVCGIRIKGGKPFCARHMKSKQALDYLKNNNETKEEPKEELEVGEKRKREEEPVVEEPPKKRTKLDNDLTQDYQKEYKRSGGERKRPAYLSRLDSKLQANENKVDRLGKNHVEVESDDEDDSDDEMQDEQPEIKTTPTLPSVMQLRQMSQQLNKGRHNAPEPVVDPVALLGSLGITSGNALLETYAEPLLLFGTGMIEKASDKMKGLTNNVKSNDMLLKAYKGMIREKAPDFLLELSDTKMFCICMTICFVQTYSQNKFNF